LFKELVEIYGEIKVKWGRSRNRLLGKKARQKEKWTISIGQTDILQCRDEESFLEIYDYRFGFAVAAPGFENHSRRFSRTRCHDLW
jgi:hypothetical protein